MLPKKKKRHDNIPFGLGGIHFPRKVLRTQVFALHHLSSKGKISATVTPNYMSPELMETRDPYFPENVTLNYKLLKSSKHKYKNRIGI